MFCSESDISFENVALFLFALSPLNGRDCTFRGQTQMVRSPSGNLALPQTERHLFLSNTWASDEARTAAKTRDNEKGQESQSLVFGGRRDLWLEAGGDRPPVCRRPLSSTWLALAVAWFGTSSHHVHHRTGARLSSLSFPATPVQANLPRTCCVPALSLEPTPTRLPRNTQLAALHQLACGICCGSSNSVAPSTPSVDGLCPASRRLGTLSHASRCATSLRVLWPPWLRDSRQTLQQSALSPSCLHYLEESPPDQHAEAP